VRRLISLAAIVAVVVVLGGAPAGAVEPVPTPFPAPEGPALSVPQAQLLAALSCPSTFTSTAHEPVLLVHGTGATPELNWGWNYAKVLPTLGYDVCTVRLPNRALDDIQVSSEYVVYAMREIARRSGHMVDVMGHSQGGIEPRWALKWWPDTQQLVDDWVMLASPNHGTVVADAVPNGFCTEACYQMRTTSKFMAALNAGDETPGAVSYTSLYSQTDELVQPSITARLDGASNIAIQDVCPGRPVEHASMAADAAVYALVIDAFTHAGPADPSRFNPAVCGQGTFLGVDPLSGFAEFLQEILTARSNPIHPVAGEPPLASYTQGAPATVQAGQAQAAPRSGASPSAGGTTAAPAPTTDARLPATGGTSGAVGLVLAVAGWLLRHRRHKELAP
jgi:hypothetical protein